jgi:ribosomal protein S1
LKWLGDVRDHYNVGDKILARVFEVKANGLEDISVIVDAKSIGGGTVQDNLRKCRVQSKYVGTVTDMHKGVVFIRLSNGVNAVAHSCLDRRTPGRKDEVSFVVTQINEERGIAVGAITRIIKQNL